MEVDLFASAGPLFTLVVGGAIGLVCQQILGIWIKPNYYTKGSNADH
jgi:hypothetical protein